MLQIAAVSRMRFRLPQGIEPTKAISFLANRTAGTQMTAKKTVRIAKPRAARVCEAGRQKPASQSLRASRAREQTYQDSVVPSKDGQLIETGNKVPACSDVASYEYAEGEDGEGVHEAYWSRQGMPQARGVSIPRRGRWRPDQVEQNGVEGRKSRGSVHGGTIRLGLKPAQGRRQDQSLNRTSTNLKLVPTLMVRCWVRPVTGGWRTCFQAGPTIGEPLMCTEDDVGITARPEVKQRNDCSRVAATLLPSFPLNIGSFIHIGCVASNGGRVPT